MGLDQYCLAKRAREAKAEVDNLTGACGGLFPFAPKSDKTQIGYWRKFYALDDYIQEIKGYNTNSKNWGEMNCKDIRLSKENVQKLIDHSQWEIEEILDHWEGEVPSDDSEDYWDLRDWEHTIDVFKEALDLINSEGAEIYYKYWR